MVFGTKSRSFSLILVSTGAMKPFPEKHLCVKIVTHTVNCEVTYYILISLISLTFQTVRSEKARDVELTADQNTTNLCNNTSRHCYNLVDSLTSSVAYQDLFSTKINLFPPSLVCFNQETGGGKKSLPALGKLKVRYFPPCGL